MFLGKVIGTVVSTHKREGLLGMKLLVVEPFDPKNDEVKDSIVAVDTIGAGIGELVIITSGTPAQTSQSSSFDKKPPIDAAVVGIVDAIEIPGKG